MGRVITQWPIGRGRIEQWEDDQGKPYYRAVVGDQARSCEDLYLAEMYLGQMVKAAEAKRGSPRPSGGGDR
jgi:hypothetical protein